jgi:hypothetical protein
MRSLFRSFERDDLEYLLISGQASVLYGAATFSEDVDIWVRPKAANLPVVGIQDLVALKKTRRLADYDIISNLAQVRLAEAGPAPSRALLRWTARHCFRAEERVPLLARLGEGRSVGACREDILREIAQLQARDVRYWKTRIDELRRLRRSGRLWPESTPISAILNATKAGHRSR